MTIAELIEALKQYPQTAVVQMFNGDFEEILPVDGLLYNGSDAVELFASGDSEEMPA